MAEASALPRIALVTTFFPNRVFPHRTVFLKNLTGAFRRHVPVDVVAPVPYAPPVIGIARWRKLRAIPATESIEDMAVCHPRYGVLPKLDALSGMTYFLGVMGVLKRLRAQHGRFLVHAHCAYPDGVGAALAARALDLPYVITAHGSDLNVYAKQRLLRPQIRWAFGGARGVIAVSRELEAKAAALAGQVPVERIPCAGFNPEIFFPRPRQDARSALKPAIASAARVVIFVGNLVPVKAVDALLSAWATLRARGALNDTDRLIIIGDGPERVRLAAMAVDGTHFAGALPQPEVARWIAAADVLCLPSRHEGMPNVVVEALASGIPVVASRVGGIPELVTDGVNGRLATAGNAMELSDALYAVLTGPWDPATIRSSVSHLTWDALAVRNLDFLARVMSGVR